MLLLFLFWHFGMKWIRDWSGQDISLNFSFHVPQKTKSVFGITWEWLNDDRIFLFVQTITLPSKHVHKCLRTAMKHRSIRLSLPLTFFNLCLLRMNHWPISAAAQYRTAPRPTLLRLKLQHQQDGELDDTRTHSLASALLEMQKTYKLTAVCAPVYLKNVRATEGLNQ